MFRCSGGGRPDEDGRVQLLGDQDSGAQPGGAQDLDRRVPLPLARLHEQAAAGREPLGRFGGDPAHDVEPVAAPVQGDAGFVDASLGGQQLDVAGGDVGDVGEQHVDPAAEGGGQRGEQVTLVDLPQVADVAPGAAHGGGFDVAGVQFGRVRRGGEGDAERAGAAAEVDDDGPAGCEGRGLRDQELRTAAGHEDARVHGEAATVEVRPAQDVFERQSGGAALDEEGQFVGGGGGLVEETGLVLGEDTAGAAEGDDGGGERPGGGGGEGTEGVNRHTSEAFRENRWALRDRPMPSGRLLPVVRRDRAG